MFRTFFRSRRPLKRPTVLKKPKAQTLRFGLVVVSLAMGSTARSVMESAVSKQSLSNAEHPTIILSIPIFPSIVDIPGLEQDEGAIHGVTTCYLGNLGFVTLADGVTAPELVATITQAIAEIARYTQEKSNSSACGKKPLLILNETAYASTKAPGLLKNSEGKPEFIWSLAEDNIGDFIEKNRFSEGGDFERLRDCCIRVTADGFVSNLSSFQDYQLYFAANTADAAPVVLSDPKSGVIGIMSCSWHNVAKGEFDELIHKMTQLGAKPEEIRMGIGPGLGPNSYEFGARESRYFCEDHHMDQRDGRAFQGRPSLEQFIAPHPSDAKKVLLNMPGMLTQIAAEHGIQSQRVHYSKKWDSKTNSLFFSARRDTLPEQQPQESAKKYPRTARGVTYIHLLEKPAPEGPVKTQPTFKR